LEWETCLPACSLDKRQPWHVINKEEKKKNQDQEQEEGDIYTFTGSQNSRTDSYL